jgi:predicted nucleotide-binding protein (sugar kinase/HSP70/actin superfamily)
VNECRGVAVNPDNHNKLFQILEQEGVAAVMKDIELYLAYRIINHQKPIAQSVLQSVVTRPTVSSINTLNSLSSPLWWSA